MELLVLKTDDGYIRVLDDQYQSCGLDKASVFPLNQVETVKSHRDRLARSGFPHPFIAQLNVTETAFNEDMDT